MTCASASELYFYHFQNSEPKFYTRVPNIIDYLTYQTEEDGKKVTKRLSVYAKELYRVIRMIASDHGTDWHTTESLAEIIGCSTGMIHKAKEELLMPMDQLDNNPLILETRKQITKLVGGRKVKTVLCTRTIVDIWPWNNAFMATLKYQKKQSENSPDSPHESAIPPDSPHESASLGPHSYGDANNNTNKIPLSKKQQPTADADLVVSIDTKKRLFPSERMRRVYEWMVGGGCLESTAYATAKKFDEDDIVKASNYLHDKAKNSKTKPRNKWATFHDILNNRYWEKRN